MWHSVPRKTQRSIKLIIYFPFAASLYLSELSFRLFFCCVFKNCRYCKRLHWKKCDGHGIWPWDMTSGLGASMNKTCRPVKCGYIYNYINGIWQMSWSRVTYRSTLKSLSENIHKTSWSFTSSGTKAAISLYTEKSEKGKEKAVIFKNANLSTWSRSRSVFFVWR